jgi:hypothetical protein
MHETNTCYLYKNKLIDQNEHKQTLRIILDGNKLTGLNLLD